MLTKDLLDFGVRKGKIRPRFVKVDDEDLTALASDLIALVDAGVGQSMGTLEDGLEARAKAHKYVKQARGMAKLLLDRVEVESPEEAALERRTAAFHTAAAAFQGLSDEASFEDYEAAVDPEFPEGLQDIRHNLYADLPERRTVLEANTYTPQGLLERYNLAQAQGLVLRASRLELQAPGADLAVARRILRWLKFCRLVADISHADGDLWLGIEGPAALFSATKKYGLQLANFLAAVPLLSKFELSAEVQMGRRPVCTLTLTHKDKLVSTLKTGIGHVPEEVSRVVDKFDDEELWKVELTPKVRTVGITGACVPDLTLVHKTSGQEVAVELFHAWHKGPLQRRLDELEARPDPSLFLGVDRSLAKNAEWADHPQVFLFNAFPSMRALRNILKQFED